MGGEGGREGQRQGGSDLVFPGVLRKWETFRAQRGGMGRDVKSVMDINKNPRGMIRDLKGHVSRCEEIPTDLSKA